MYCLAKPYGGDFNRGTRNLSDYLKDNGQGRKVSETRQSGDWRQLHALYFTSNPWTYDSGNANRYQEWVPGMTKFNSPTDTISKVDIVNICTYPGDIVKCPEDCTGLFSNFSLGYSPNSYTYTEHFERWSREYELSSDWTKIYENNSNNSKESDINIDFSGFDFSETKNMTSLFENCIGTESPINHVYTWNPQYVMVSPPGAYLWKHIFRRTWKYNIRHITFSGLAGWDTSNVENISRMFANIKWNAHSTSAYTGPFNIDGVNNFDFPKVTNASNLFAGSNINLEGVVFNIGGESIDFSYAFSNYKWLGSDTLNMSSWSITSTDGNLQSMFRNSDLKGITLGSSLDNVVTGMTEPTNINYMFCSDSTTASGLKFISARNYSDWKIMNPKLTGYKMFLNCSKLPNYIVGETDINHANNTRIAGYFDQAPPEKTEEVFFKKTFRGVPTWLASDIYIKLDDGWVPVTGVYI